MSIFQSSIFALLTIILLTLNAYCQTQREMEDTASNQLNLADKKLNAIYQQVIRRYRGNSTFIRKLRNAEKAWIAYRDDYLHLRFPADDHIFTYGSVFTRCCLILTEGMTRDRTDQLKELLTIKKAPVTAEISYMREEKILNDVYKKVLRIYEKPYLKVLRQNELNWIVFRDADANAFASLSSISDSSGMRFAKLAELDHQRTKELRQWIDGVKEGDMCAGCIPIH